MKFKFLGKNAINRLPKAPGVYAFKKGKGFLYIGKAANLKERVKNHFFSPTFRDNLFVNQADKIGFIKTGSDIEALILEANLIKKHKPKYNVVWRDDKNYFYVGITKEDFPTVFITHQPLRQAQGKPKLKTDYVGPFVEGRALKQTLNILRRIFPYRTCKPYSGTRAKRRVEKNERSSTRPCLWYQLGRCPGPCILGSKLAKELPNLEKTIKKESQRNIKNLKKFLEGKKTEVLKNLKKEMKSSSKIHDFETAAKIRDQILAIERILEHGRIFNYPSEAKGGEERTFFDRLEPETSRIRRSPDSQTWKEIEKNLRKILKIKKGIKRIEAYDVSNIQGQNATGSMVTFIKGEPNKNFYRHFKIRIEAKPNDVAMIKEVLNRRFSHPEWGWPDLILIDGGKAQLNAAVSSIGYPVSRKKIPVMALAKRENELFLEGEKEPLLLKNLPRDIFNLILQLRDEAHRFAITYHRKLREKF